jgi:succinate dehydrogenase / fumarate reductase flavoprotein subunit
MDVQGDTTPVEFWRALGKIVWDEVGMGRNEAGLKKAIAEIQALRQEFWTKVKVDGEAEDLNKNLEFAGRVADYLELAELMAIDALNREESCGGHFREEHQQDGEAVRHDDKFCYVAGWKYSGDVSKPELHKEPLHFESIKLQQRSYK